LIQGYERRGHFEEIISLLEAGLSLERAHVRSLRIIQSIS
jgi:clathrin heavy chain